MDNSFKDRVRSELISGAMIFKREYVDYEYLLYSKDMQCRKYYIINANVRNYKHLSGVESNLSPLAFFDMCYAGTIQVSDFDCGNKHAKGTVRRKIKLFSSMLSLFCGDSIMLEENLNRNKVSCVLGTSNSSCTLGFEGGKKLRPKTLMKGCALDKQRIIIVDLILRKKITDTSFNELIYHNPDVIKTTDDIVSHLNNH